jgi:rod shape-determining protein MreC
VTRRQRAGTRLDTGLLVACVALAGLAIVARPRVGPPVVTALRGSVIAPLAAVQAEAQALRAALTRRNAELVARGRVVTQAQALPAVEAENARLRALLGLGARLGWGFRPADVLALYPPGDDHTLTLSAGSTVGVAPYTPVIAADGLVGIVQAVEPRTATAITWAHPDFRVSAMSADEGAFGIVQAHVDRDDQRLLLEMRGVPFRATLAPGTLIVSSGLGATFPRGIPVGTVVAELPTTEKWARTYLLRPAVAPTAISPVLLLLPPRAAAGVDTVWTSIGRADSLTRTIAEAGDSLARRAALAELAARRAALDSARLDSLRRLGVPAEGTARPDSAAPAVPPAPVRDTTRGRAPVARPDSLRRPPR